MNHDVLIERANAWLDGKDHPATSNVYELVGDLLEALQSYPAMTPKGEEMWAILRPDGFVYNDTLRDESDESWHRITLLEDASREELEGEGYRAVRVRVTVIEESPE